MKKFAIILIFVNFCIISHSQNLDLIVDCQKLILKTFYYQDFNPIHKPETDSINKIFQTILLRRDKTTIQSDYNKEIESLFHLIYNNGFNEYEDSPDYRRLKMRRALGFASIALISDLDKTKTFLEYAKLSLIENIDDPDDELLENQYLGLLIIELMIAIEEDYINMEDLNRIENYLDKKKDMIVKQNHSESKEIIQKCKLVIK